MVTKEEVVGLPTGKAVITIERGPVSAFAAAVTDANPVYRDASAAQAAGFDNIPIPPTYFFSAAGHWGAFSEQQPADAKPDIDPLAHVIGSLMRNGGIVLHGEEEFTYHAPICVGDVVTREGKVVDLYEKPTGDRVMTFLVTEDEYRNERGELVLTARMNLIHRS